MSGGGPAPGVTGPKVVVGKGWHGLRGLTVGGDVREGGGKRYIIEWRVVLPTPGGRYVGGRDGDD